MSDRRLVQAVLALFFALALGMGGILTNAAPAAQLGTLQNPGFEDPFVPFQDDTTRMVANGWAAWHVPQREGDEGFRNLKPEYQPASADNPDRILAGNNAQQYFSFFATHTGGLYQQVQMVPGSTATFSAFIYVWSTRFDDPNRSEDPGRVQVQVGIDPQGGTDGESERIVWSTPLEYYDQYREVSVTVPDTGSRITVFVRTSFDQPQKNTVYVDEARLVVQQPAQPTATATATTTSTLAPSITPQPTLTTAAPTVLPSPTTGSVGFPTPTQEVDPNQTEQPLPSPTPATNQEFPSQIIHTVVAGDTVGALATRYGSTVEAIIAANGLNSDALIYVAQELIIPVRTAAPTAVPAPTLLPPPTAVQPTPIGILPTNTPVGIINADPSSGFTIYTVQRGDTLSRIAAQYNINLQTLVQLNGILNPNLIRVGQQLRVPGSAQPQPTPTTQAAQPTAQPSTPRVHVVQRGENLFRISLRYGVPVATLASLNGILNVNRVYVGQVITLP